MDEKSGLYCPALWGGMCVWVQLGKALGPVVSAVISESQDWHFSWPPAGGGSAQRDGSQAPKTPMSL